MAKATDPIGAVLMFGDELIAKLDKIDKRFAELEKHTKSMANNIDRAFNSASIQRFNQSIEQMTKKIGALKSGSSGNFSSINTSLTNMARVMQNTSAVITTLQKSVNALNATMSNQNTNVNNVTRSTRRQTQTTQKQTQATNAQTQAVNRQKKATQSLTSASKDLLGLSGQLRGMLSTVFSLYQITGFIRKLMQVSGEFELQHRSLQILIQDVDKADKLWSQVTKLAVESPFRVKELVTYTKQLAAFRIETDKLFDVTKRLADVSAGLGVDMNRLILAYGQVRAANYLRGQELRQFSEAGINILGELADKFTEVEGRTVTVGEVFERVSKRMVKFSDVAEVFEKLTDEGGTFYKMQEKQAETLKGRISNLKDSFDLMYDSIGKANRGTLVKLVGLGKEAADNWQKFAVVVVPLFGAMLAEGTIIGIERLVKALKSISAVGKISYIVVLLLTVANIATRIIGEMGRFKREMEDLAIESKASLDTSVKRYDDLLTKLKEANEGSEDRKRIIAQLNSEYGQYLPYLITEKTTMEELANSYDDVVQRMKEAVAYRTYEKGLQKIEDEYIKKLPKAIKQLENQLSSSIKVESGATTKTFLPSEKDIANLTSLIVQGFSEAEDKSLSGFIEFANKTVRSYFGNENMYIQGLSGEVYKVISDRYKKLDQWQGTINAQFEETYNSQKAFNEIKKKELELVEEIADIEAGRDHNTKETIKNLNEWERELLKRTAKIKNSLEVIDLKIKFNIISEREGKKQKEKLTKLADEWANVINERIIKEFGGEKDELIGFYGFNKFIDDFLITNDKASQGIKANVKELQDMLKGSEESLIEQAKLIENGIVPANNKIYRTDKLRVETLRKILQMYGEEIDESLKLSKWTIESINSNPLLKDEYKLKMSDQYKKLSDLQSEINKKFKTAQDEYDSLLSLQMKGVDIDKGKLAILKEQVEQYRIMNDMLDANTKEDYMNQQNFRDMFIKDLEDRDIAKFFPIKASDTRKTIKSALDSDIKEYEEEVKRIDKGLKEGIFGDTINTWKKKELEDLIKKLKEMRKLYYGDEDTGDSTKKSDFARMYRLIVEMNREYDRLRENFTEGESKNKVVNSFRDAFNEAFQGYLDIGSVDFTTKKGTASALDKLRPLAESVDAINKNKDAMFGLLKALGEVLDQIDEQERKLIRDTTKRHVEDLFDSYEFEKELKSLNVSKDVLKNLFGITPTTLEEIEDEIRSMAINGLLDEQMQKDLLERVHDLEEKEQRDRLKSYVGYLREAMNARVKIEYEAMRKIDDINSMKNVDEGTKSMMILGVNRERDEALSKQVWEDFKGTDGYINLFKDLERQSVAVLMNMRSKIETLRGSLKGLTATEMKDMQEQIQKIDDIIDKKNPFGGIYESMRDVIGMKSRPELEKQKRELESQLAMLTSNRDNAQLQFQLASNKGDEEGAKRWSTAVGSLNKQMEVLDGKIIVISNDISKWDRLEYNIGLAAAATKELTDEIYGLVTAFGGVKTEAGKAMQEIIGDTIEAIPQMFALVTAIQEVTAAETAMQAAAGWIGVISMAVSLIIKGITAIANYHDAKQQDYINAIQKRVDRLQESFENLQTDMERAFAFDQVITDNQAALDNLEKQIADYRQMISKERAKKNTDEDQVIEWERTVRDIEKQIEEQQIAFIQKVGGIGKDSYASQAEAFADAWLSAFNDGEDAMEALEDTWDETINNMIKKQLTLRVASKYFDELFSYVDNVALNDGRLTAQELDSIQQRAQAAMQGFSEDARALVDALGFLGTGSTTQLSELVQGIQGMTEQTAEVIASYLNSIRFFVAQNSNTLASVASRILSTDASENPILSELRAQTRLVTNIESLLTSVKYSSAGGSGLKVYVQ